MSSKPWVFWAVALAGLAGGALLLVPGARPAARSEGVSAPAAAEAPGSKGRWETLKAEVVERLDELEQRQEELDGQQVAVRKAEAALALAHRELDAAERAAHEYEDGIARQERAQAEAELALAEAEYKAAVERRPGPPDRQGAGAAPPPPAPEPGPDDQVVPRAKLALELTRLKHETLVRLTQPRRSAELRRDLTRARDDAALKQAALDQEKSDYARLEKLLRDDALEPDERRALALLAELWGGGASEAASQGRGGGQLAKRFEDASALWKGAGRARTARRDQALRSRLLRASGPGSAGAGSK